MRAWAGRRPELAVEWPILLVSVFLALTANTAFWRGVLEGRDPGAPATWGFAAATFAMLVAINVVLPALVATRRTVRPVLAVLLLFSASAGFYAVRYGVAIDPSMIRNVLATDTREAGELLTFDMVRHVVMFGMLPAAAVFLVRIRPRTWRRAIPIRIGTILLAAFVGAGALMSVFQDFGSLMRNQHALRYQITPANVLWSLASVAGMQASTTAATRVPPDPATRRVEPGRRPALMVIVVGETVRAANWQLNGYARPTTPELARRDVVSFTRTTSCGTSTDVSLPCMFSPYGRADYDDSLIRRTDSLLHVLAAAGVKVLWRDNQSGCKGVCTGLETQDLSRSSVPALCAEDRCLDEILLHGLDAVVRGTDGDLVVVLHQLGNHGPAYHRRYPPEYRLWTPACERKELRDCSRDEIVNAYDNAIAYTDRFLARTLDFLEGQRERFDVGMVYLSDHGESLGERGLYLHGVPYAFAPREQLEVPMFWWFAPEAADAMKIDLACLRLRAVGPSSHDDLYHSVLGAMQVATPRYKPARDVFSGCRRTG